MGIQDLLRSLTDLEVEMLSAERHFNDQFRMFAKLWKEILSEKKELNTRLADLKKVRAARDGLERRVSKTDPADVADKRRAELHATARKEKELADAVAAKLLEVQQDKHEALRAGYTGLYHASSTAWAVV